MSERLVGISEAYLNGYQDAKNEKTTTDELMNLLPTIITLKEGEPFNNFRMQMTKSSIIEDDVVKDIYSINYYCDTFEHDDGEKVFIVRKLFPKNIFDTCFNTALQKTLAAIRNIHENQN